MPPPALIFGVKFISGILPLANLFGAVFWAAAAISHDWLCFVNTNIGNEVLVSLLPFSVLLETSGKRQKWYVTISFHLSCEG
jgi:hypothetical protein